MNEQKKWQLKIIIAWNFSIIRAISNQSILKLENKHIEKLFCPEKKSRNLKNIFPLRNQLIPKDWEINNHTQSQWGEIKPDGKGLKKHKQLIWNRDEESLEKVSN